MEEEFRLLKTFKNPLDANLTKGLLESNGIEAFIFDENIAYVNPVLTTAIGGVKLLVSSKDYEKAAALLSEVDEDINNEELKIKCPVCGSLHIKILNTPNWIAFLIMLSILESIISIDACIFIWISFFTYSNTFSLVISSILKLQSNSSNKVSKL